ncbi:YbjN domain-containing protein [Deinococcus planocerae]|uniref:YbjN domain-containing protein n=1 Tax=Deinococcus planocerae TaxID=1737569 RepID=UPI000C7F3EDA|nr:YbjN domain-containing protein [Deinococcus planocerae]
MHRLGTSAAALLLTASLGAAQAGGAQPPAPGGGQVQAATPATVAATLREAGYTVTVNPVEGDDEPSLAVKAGDYELDVWFSGCKGTTCDRVTASTNWDYRDDEESLDTEFVNEWNGNFFTQAYVYEGGYYLDSTLTLRGGYTKVALRAWMEDYLGDVEDFEAELP